jgi:hypothetical protein
MTKLTLTKTALTSLAVLIPVLKRSVNKNGVIPYGAKIDDNATEFIALLRKSNDISNAGDLSTSQVAHLLLSDSFLFEGS